MQHSVNPVANPDPILKRLDVNVRSSQLNRFANHQLHEPDHGSGRLVSPFLDTKLGVRGFCEVDGGIREFLQHRVSRFTFDLPIISVDRLLNSIARGECNLHVAIQDEPQFFDCVHIARVADQDGQHALLLLEWQDRVFTSHRLRYQLNDALGHFISGQVDVRDVVLGGHRLHHLIASGVAQLNQNVPRSLSRLTSNLVGLPKLINRDDLIADQNFRKTTNSSCHKKPPQT